MKNILLSGKPGSGKTTLVLKAIKDIKAYGFYTKEIRKNGERVGFELCTITGEKGILAHKDIKSNLRVGKYGVGLKDLEEIGVSAIKEGIKNNALIVIDEIGKMELFSDKFKSIVFEALDSKSTVLATIMEKNHPVSDQIKARQDVKLVKIENIDYKEFKKLLNAEIH
ncbi:NTPase [candidate division WOR-3 bacterium]|nr:NTPase [candidate division WOR-3 bacterium]